MSQGMIFFGYALAFRFGAFLVTLDDDHVLHAEFQDLFRVLFAIIFGAFAVGQASTFAPDYTKARVAANRVFALLDHTPLIDNYSTEGQQPVRKTIHCIILYRIYCNRCIYIFGIFLIIYFYIFFYFRR